jgi:hypothetical protein
MVGLINISYTGMSIYYLNYVFHVIYMYILQRTLFVHLKLLYTIDQVLESKYIMTSGRIYLADT